MNTDDIYNNVMASTNGAKIAFIASTLDILKGVKVKDREISVLRNKMSNLLWEWQQKRDDYLYGKKPETVEQCEILYSYKIYQLVKRIYDRCYIHKNESIENTVCAVLYDVCLFSTWFLLSVEGFYLGRLPKYFASDIADVNLNYIRDIIDKSSKRNENYLPRIYSITDYLKTKHPISNEEPLGQPIYKKEIESKQ